MRVTFVMEAPGLTGGSRVVGIYAEQLHKRGHDVCVVQRPESARTKLRNLVRGWGRTWYSGTSPSYFDTLDVERRTIDRKRAIVDDDVPDADVVVATWYKTAPWVADLSPEKGRKAYFMQDYGGAFQPLEEVRETWRMPLEMITISEWLRGVVREEVGKDIALVPNGVDHSVFRTEEKRRKPRVATVGFTYSPLPQKGVDLLADAVAIARETVSDLQVTAFGATRPKPDIALPSGLTYHLRASDAELADIYRSCTAWLFSSRREGFGLPILESMACGTPVVATHAGASQEILRQGGGKLVPTYEPAAIAEAMVDICRLPPEEWDALSREALDVASNYTWDRSGEMFERELLRIAGLDA